MDAVTSARKLADKGTVGAGKTIDEAAETGREAAHRAENGSWRGAEGLIDYNRRLLEMSQANVDAAFEYAQDVVGVRSLSEFVEISTQYARNQSAAMTEQARDLATRAQKLAITLSSASNRQEAVPVRLTVSGLQAFMTNEPPVLPVVVDRIR